MNRIIHWFTSDLRLHDMPSLHAASHAEALLPVYIFSTKSEINSPHGFPRIGPFRKTFLKQTLLALKESLQVKNSELFILEGNPEEILPELVRIFDINCIHVEEPISSEEINCINAVEQAVNIPVRRFESRTFYTEQQLPFALQQLPGTFTTFRTLMESSQGYDVNELVDIDLPPLPISKDTIEHQWTWKDDGIYIKPDPRSALKAIGGEIEGLKRLHYYTNETHVIATYKSTRNGLIGDVYSSKFSPWLALGALSVKHIMRTINHYEDQYQANESTYWMKFELLWREFFQWTIKKHGDACFRFEGIRGKKQCVDHDQKLIDDWRFGRTQDNFVNANMKELLLTGFMSNRGRQNVASYFVHILKQDWRIGAEWFESQLIDYDVASNWGNWMYVAGVGNDPRQDRVFNTKKQADMYDANGEYQSLWI